MFKITYNKYIGLAVSFNLNNLNHTVRVSLTEKCFKIYDF
jgi:hypothetical protein